MAELGETRILANRILDRPHGDPDDDLAMLSRQLLRADEHVEKAADLLCNVAQILDVIKGEWGEAWSAWDQEQRDGITAFLKFYYAKKEEFTAGHRKSPEERIAVEFHVKSEMWRVLMDGGYCCQFASESDAYIYRLGLIQIELKGRRS